LKTTISDGNFSASIHHLGAELFSFKNTKTNVEYMWEGNPDFWPKHSPILFPIVGTLKNNTYTHKNLKYKLPRHGFARECNFERIRITENSATFSLSSTPQYLAVYPFPFELQIKYTLESNCLQLTYNIINIGSYKLPFSIGAHPALALPGNFEDYSIVFEKEEILSYHRLKNNLITDKTSVLVSQDKKVSLNYELFKDDALIFKKLESKSITILKNNVAQLRVQFPNFPHLGIWTKVNAPFLCIEPWYGYSDTENSTGNLFEKEGIQVLEPNANFETTFSIEILS
jgi:galactose mutarotase-like enzyme